MKRNIKNKILQLRAEGRSYSEICRELNCNKAAVSYHCGRGQKEKTLQRNKNIRSKAHPFYKKLDNFKHTKNSKYKTFKTDSTVKHLIIKKIIDFHKGTNMENAFTVNDIINKFGENPVCYLTGQPININNPRSYHFDHKVPRSRGGSNTIDNLGICTKTANQAKTDMTHDEFIEFCKSVLSHHEYNINKK